MAISPLDDTGWAISFDEFGEGHLYHQLADGTIVDVLNITEYQAGDPDPVDVEDNPTESNPYGLTVMSNGDALVADAAGNDLIRVTPDGVATTVARFDVQTVSTDHLPPDFPGGPLPPTLDAESVPTTVTIGPDGAIYVGELKGFPFRRKTSSIWRIKPNAEGAWCSVNERDPARSCSRYSRDYTAIQDITFNKANRRLYVYQLAAAGVLAFEAGFDPSGPGFPPAVLLEVERRGKNGRNRTQLAAGELSQPGGVEVIRNRIFVTDGLFTEGRLIRVNRIP